MALGANNGNKSYTTNKKRYICYWTDKWDIQIVKLCIKRLGASSSVMWSMNSPFDMKHRG